MTFRDLRIVFAGTPEFAAVHLNAFINCGCQFVSAYTQPDRPSGRGKRILPTPVKVVAASNGIAVRQPASLRTVEIQAELAELNPDLMIVIAYGLILPQKVLDIPRLGCINVHASLLPRWRGAAPIERAILAGDTVTGISIMQMDHGLDTGPVLATAETPISSEDNSKTLSLRLQELGCGILLKVVDDLARGNAHPVAQDNHAATYAPKLRKEEAGIIWTTEAGLIHQQVRAFYPRSPAYCLYHGQRVRIITARISSKNYSGHTPGTVVEITHEGILVACGTGTLEISAVQLEGKIPMALPVLLHGHPDYFRVGSQLLSAVAHDQSAK